MRDLVSLFRDYARLDLQRTDRGLSVRELERWSLLKGILDHELGQGSASRRLDRRSSKRIATRLRCCYASTQELRGALITQIATRGVFVATKAPLPVGTKLSLRILIEETETQIEVDGVVVSTNVSPDLEFGRSGMGIRFESVSGPAADAIAELYALEAHRSHRQTAGASEREDSDALTPDEREPVAAAAGG